MNARTPPSDLADLSDGAKLFLGTAIVCALCIAGLAMLLDLFGVLTQ